MSLNPILTVQQTNPDSSQPIAPGIVDNGTSEGIAYAKIKNGVLVKVPFSAKNWADTSIGTSNNLFSFNTTFNGNGSGSGILMRTNPGGGLTTGQSSFRFIVYGSTVGICYRFSQNALPFTVIIDGTPYAVSPLNSLSPYYNNELLSVSYVDNESLHVIATNLNEGPHSVTILNYPHPTLTSIIIVTGFLADSAAGYESEPRLNGIFPGGALTAAFVAVPYIYSDISGQNNSHKGLQSIWYTNTDTTTRVITIQANGVTIWTITLLAGASQALDLTQKGVAIGLISGTLTHKSDAAAVVNFTIIGGI